MLCLLLSEILSAGSDVRGCSVRNVCDTRVYALIETLVSRNSALTLLEPASTRGASLMFSGVGPAIYIAIAPLILGHLLHVDIYFDVSTVVTSHMVGSLASLGGCQD